MEELFNILARWLHVLFGITWVGMLYYFNFVQGSYFKQASPEGLADAKMKLAPNALGWFRWSAMLTFITGILLFGMIGKLVNNYIMLGALMGTLMFLNVWLIIWPAQKIALGMVEGDVAKASAKAMLASRTNTVFSAPMLLGMLAGPHAGGYGTGIGGTDLLIGLAIIIALEINAVVGKLGPMASVRGVIHCAIALVVVFIALMALVP